MNIWEDVLRFEELPLTCNLDFHIQNGGVCRVVKDGQQVKFSSKSRNIAASFIRQHRLMRIPSHSLDCVITLDFHNGIINGNPKYGNRKESYRHPRNQLLEAIKAACM
jgi:hypothetical protein